MVPKSMFSIVVPLWNKRHTVAATLATALAQSWRDFELIIVDDGSTDGGMEVAARFDDPRIRRLRQANKGPGAARNAAIRAARHDWFAFLDADDLWLPDHLEELDRIRRRFPEAGLIGTKILRSDRRGRYRLPAREEGRIERVDYFDCGVRGSWSTTTSSAAIPRRTWEALGGFGDAPCGQDIEYWTRIALDLPVAVSRRATAVYITGTGGICDTVRSPCLARELEHWGDICPAMAVLRDRQAEGRSPELARSIDGYIDRQFRYSTRHAARLGDLRTLRSLPRLYLRRPPLSDRLLLAWARAPAPVARAGFAIGLGLKALLRALSRRTGPAARRTCEVRQCSGGSAASRLAAAAAPAQSELV
ncbi:MAG TPA: glycosyltransferase family A protein [Allosphingosinicella sp.]|nr:glycosyltransferase family A protein [Allosphingosinicella sp.]